MDNYYQKRVEQLGHDELIYVFKKQVLANDKPYIEMLELELEKRLKRLEIPAQSLK